MRASGRVVSCLGFAFLLAGPDAGAQGALKRLAVSPNQRFLVTQDGRPFFYLGDTAWELFHRLDREDAERYLENRARKGFTVIQAVALAEFDGLGDPNAYGHLPLVELDPTRPDVQPGPDDDYWDHVDWIVAKANALGLYVGFLPTWGDKWNKKWGGGPEIFTAENAARLRRVARPPLPRPRAHLDPGRRPAGRDRGAARRSCARWRSGLRSGDGGAHLDHVPPAGRQRLVDAGSTTRTGSTSTCGRTATAPSSPAATTRRAPTTTACPIKPVLDGEPIYEDHPVSFKAKELGHSIAADVRRAVLLGPVLRRLRPHLRPSLRLADVGAGARADQQPADAVDRGDRPARRAPDADTAGGSSSRGRS